MKANPFAAEILENSATGFATAACGQLREDSPAVMERFAPRAADSWKKHYVQRLLELAAAVAAGQPELFVSRVSWSKRAFEARGFQSGDLTASLQSLKQVLGEKLPPTASEEALQCIEAAVADLDKPAVAEESQLDAVNPRDKLALLYLQSVLEGNVRHAMQSVLDSLDDFSVKEIILRVLIPAQTEIGRLWHLDQVSVAEEHLVTTTTQRLMAIVVEHAKRKPDNGKTALAAAVAGNVHDVGIRAIGYLLELEGWRTIFLGADVPRRDLPAAAQFFNTDVVLLSCALSVQLKSVRNTVAEIRKRCEQPVKIMVGGLAFYGSPDLWRSTGADGYAENADDALARADELTADA